MKFIRKLYFNPIVNRLNKNLKIRQKSYLAFLLVSIMIVLFSVYVLFTYSEIKKREFQFQSLYTIQNCNNSLIKLLKNKIQSASSRDEIVQNINKLKRSVQYLEDHNIWLRSRVKEINNTLYTIENLSFLTNRSGVVVIDQSKNQEIAQINDIIDDLMVYNGKIENNITIISSQTETMFRQKNIMIYLIMLTGLFGSIIIANFISYRITNPIEKLKDNIKILENGNYNLDSNFEVLDNDEIGDIVRGIEGIGSTIKETVLFTEKIGRNELDSNLDLNNKGKLGQALLSMRDNLNEVTKQNEIQKLQEQKRNWVIKGLAELGNVLRSNYDDTSELYFNILRTIINYINANQGGFFILTDDDNGKILELSSSYAYDRRKYLTKKIEIGEGLIGQCAYEKQITDITDIPEDYINITSGLGKSNPRNLILVPLVINDELYGVIELASFEVFDEHTIDYLTQSAESVASSIASVEINNKTKLLLEKTKVQAEEIASREEEMRQNMEELEATQEESSRKVEHLEQIIAELRKSKEKKSG